MAKGRYPLAGHPSPLYRELVCADYWRRAAARPLPAPESHDTAASLGDGDRRGGGPAAGRLRRLAELKSSILFAVSVCLILDRFAVLHKFFKRRCFIHQQSVIDQSLIVFGKRGKSNFPGK